MNLYSKVLLDIVELYYFVEDDVFLFKVIFIKNNSIVIIFFFYFKLLSFIENKRVKFWDIELDLVGNMVCDYEELVIVVGDLNDVVWFFIICKFRKVSGFLDLCIGWGFYNIFYVYYFLIKWFFDYLFYLSYFLFVDICKFGDIGFDYYLLLIML